MRKGIFEGIGDKFVGYQSQRDGGIHTEHDIVNLDRYAYLVRLLINGRDQILDQFVDVFAAIDLGKVLFVVQHLVDKRH